MITWETHEFNLETVKVSDIITAKKTAVRKLSIMLMQNMAEMNIDMIRDNPEEYPTKAIMEKAFNWVHQQSADTLDDIMSDLREAIEKELKELKYQARIRQLNYDPAGKLSDCHVEFVVET